MKNIKNFKNYMAETVKSSQSMVCPDCDGSGYLKDKSGNKTKTCPRCKGTGLLYNKKEK